MNDFISKNKNLLIIGLAGILLLVFSSALSKPPGKEAYAPSEKEFKEILQSIEGVGEISVLVNKDADGTAEGVVIVASGAENPKIKKIITDAAKAALGVPSHKVQVFKQK